MRIGVFFIAVLLACPAAAQTPPPAAAGGVTFEGRLVNALSGEAVGGAEVLLEERQIRVQADQDGRFTFTGVPPGAYHLVVIAPGYSSRRTEVTVATGMLPLDVRVDPELHFEATVSVAPEARSQFESFQPTSVLAGQELTKRLDTSLGATLESQPGVAARSFGPAPSRPVIRGLDGDRVLILQDGQRLGDLSSQSGDHAVNVNPAAARRIEVVRGPATLLYGANAIGGLVNVITDEIPTEPETGVGGDVTLDLGSASRHAAAAADVHVGNGIVALHAGGGGRRSGDARTPIGRIANSHSRNGFGSVGLAWTGERGYIGGSYGYDDTRYGIPVVEGGTLQLTPRRHALTFRGGVQEMTGAFDSVRATLGIRRYAHEELEGSDVGTVFDNDTAELELLGSHRAIGRLKGSIGGWVLDRNFAASGEEALSPPVDQNGFAAFLYEELTWPHVTFQFGARVDRTIFRPASEPDRRFTNLSGSLGLLLRPAAANDNLTIAASVARAGRSPALEELFFFGEHHGNFAVEAGNPQLESERAFGIDLSLRWRGSRGSAEVTYFRNSIDQFIVRRVLTRDEFEAREPELIARFGGREPAGHSHEHADGDDDEESLAFVEFAGADALLQGVEAHADLSLTPRLAIEAGLDVVRGSLRGSGDPLPRMPPVRGRAGLRYQSGAFQAGGELTIAAAQSRVSGAEQPTDGYQLLRLFSSYSFVSGGALNTITARLENATNELYRNHLSLIKELVPETGRTFRLLYSVGF